MPGAAAKGDTVGRPYVAHGGPAPGGPVWQAPGGCGSSSSGCGGRLGKKPSCSCRVPPVAPGGQASPGAAGAAGVRGLRRLMKACTWSGRRPRTKGLR